MNRRALGDVPLAVWGVLALALVARLWGIDHGLPYSYYPDEAHLVKRALSFGSGDLNPHWFHKPALFMYILFLAYAGYFAVGRLGGLWTGATDFGVHFILNPGPFYLIGRLLEVLLGVGTTWIVWRIGRRHFSPATGIVSSLLFALTAGAIVSGYHVKEDVPSMFFATLSIYFLLNYAVGHRTRDLLACCVAGGASAATKAYGLILLLPLLVTVAGVAFAPARRDGRLRAATGRGLLALGCFGASMFVFAPFSFLDPLGRQAMLSPILKLVGRFGHLLGVGMLPPTPDQFIGVKMGFFPGLLDYARVLFSAQGMGVVLGGMACVGAVLLLYHRRERDLLLLLYVISFIAVSVLLAPGYAEPRHQAPVYPILALFGGFAVTWAAARWRRRSVLVFAIAGASLVIPLRDIAVQARTISRTDTRSAAKKWVEANIAPGTRLLADENGPPLLTSERQLLRAIRQAEAASGTGQFTAHFSTFVQLQIAAARRSIAYDITEIRKPWWRQSEPAPGVSYLESEYDRDMANPLRPVGVEPYDHYVRGGFEYAVVQSDQYTQFLPQSPVAGRWPSFVAFYRELFARGELVRAFDPADGVHVGPVVRIYRIRP